MLLDLTMPDVDGLEFCKTIRAIPQVQGFTDCHGDGKRRFGKQNEGAYCWD